MAHDVSAAGAGLQLHLTGITVLAADHKQSASLLHADGPPIASGVT